MSKDEYSGLVGIGDVVYTKTRSVFPVNTFVLCANIWSFDRGFFFLARNERRIGTRRLRIHFQIRTSRNCKKGFLSLFLCKNFILHQFLQNAQFIEADCRCTFVFVVSGLSRPLVLE